MFSLVIKAKEILLDILFPPLCLNCQRYLEQRDKLICQPCLSLVKLNNTLFCPVCRARLAESKRICHYDSPYLLAAAGNYDDPVLQNLIHCFKYKYFKNLAPVLGEILIKYLSNLSLSMVTFAKQIPGGSSQKSVVVFIPLHPRRERKRGFNQAKLIAKIVAQYFALPLIDGLKRIKNNKPQVGLKDNEARIKNIANCFKIKNPELIQGKNIILIDDVFTSGATMNEAVKILKENGTKKIIALVIAKA